MISKVKRIQKLLPHLVTRAMDNGLESKRCGAKKVLKQLEGAFAIGFIFNGEDNLIIAARKGAPLAVGYGDGEMYLGSDAIALSPFHQQNHPIWKMAIGLLLAADNVEFYDSNNNKVERETQHSVASSMMVDKGNHRHFHVERNL